MSKSLDKKLLKGLFWSFLERFSTQGIQFVFSIIMARLLLPAEFGLIAMLSIFMAFSHAFINSGFGQALIQKKKATYIDECSIFYFNIFIAFIMAGLMFVSAPWIAKFYNQPLLVSMARVLSFSLIINSFGLVQRALLTKNLDFKTQLKISVITILLSGAVGIFLAFKGFGVWSLVILYISKDLLSTILIWIFSSWRPSIILSFTSLRSMFSFGSHLLLVSLLNSVFANIYQLVIGKLFSPALLGFYSRADSLYKYPISIINDVSNSVTFPTFSILQDDIDKLCRYARKTSKTLTVITFPLMFGLVIVARPLVHSLLTEKWISIVPYLQLLCVIGLINPLQRINYNIINALGRSDLFSKIEIADKVLVITSIAVSFRFGIIAMIYGQILCSLISYSINGYYTGKLLNHSLYSQIKDIAPNFFISFLMGLLIYSVKYLSIDNHLLLLTTQIILGGISYVSFCFIFKISAFMEIIGIANGFRLSKQ
mgnify:CR=1 FL=1|tara:strand:+ start:1005 stop:2456 length:1452 start_codon:yes stop_codon:yes gene_type:complete